MTKKNLSTAHANCVPMSPLASATLPVQLRRKKMSSDRLLTTRHSVDVGTLLRLKGEQKDTRSLLELTKLNKDIKSTNEIPDNTNDFLDPTKPCRLSQVINEEITSFNLRNRPKLEKRPSKSWMLICQSYDEEDGRVDKLPRIKIEGGDDFELPRRSSSYADISERYGCDDDADQLKLPKSPLIKSQSDTCLRKSISDIDIYAKEESESDGSNPSMGSSSEFSDLGRSLDSIEKFNLLKGKTGYKGKNNMNDPGNWLRTSSETCLNKIDSNVNSSIKANSFSNIQEKGVIAYREKRPIRNKNLSGQTDELNNQTKLKQNPNKHFLVPNFHSRCTLPPTKNRSKLLHLPLIGKKTK